MKKIFIFLTFFCVISNFLYSKQLKLTVVDIDNNKTIPNIFLIIDNKIICKSDINGIINVNEKQINSNNIELSNFQYKRVKIDSKLISDNEAILLEKYSNKVIDNTILDKFNNGKKIFDHIQNILKNSKNSLNFQEEYTSVCNSTVDFINKNKKTHFDTTVNFLVSYNNQYKYMYYPKKNNSIFLFLKNNFFNDPFRNKCFKCFYNHKNFIYKVENICFNEELKQNIIEISIISNDKTSNAKLILSYPNLKILEFENIDNNNNSLQNSYYFLVNSDNNIPLFIQSKFISKGTEKTNIDLIYEYQSFIN